MVHKCFIDESYDNKLFVLSCTIGPGDKWKLFETEWRAALDSVNVTLEGHGRSLISRYHATDCANMKREFGGWNVDEQIEFTKTLIAAAKRIPMHSVAHTILLGDIRELWLMRFGHEINATQTLEAAYYMAMQHCMMILGDFVFHLNRHIRISFIHDHSDYDAEMLKAFNYVKYTVNAPYSEVFSTIAPMSSLECLPLQLADFLAYEFFRDRRGEEFRGDDYCRRRSLLGALETGMGVSLKTIKREWIAEVMADNTPRN